MMAMLAVTMNEVYDADECPAAWSRLARESNFACCQSFEKKCHEWEYFDNFLRKREHFEKSKRHFEKKFRDQDNFKINLTSEKILTKSPKQN